MRNYPSDGQQSRPTRNDRDQDELGSRVGRSQSGNRGANSRDDLRLPFQDGDRGDGHSATMGSEGGRGRFPGREQDDYNNENNGGGLEVAILRDRLDDGGGTNSQEIANLFRDRLSGMNMGGEDLAAGGRQGGLEEDAAEILDIKERIERGVSNAANESEKLWELLQLLEDKLNRFRSGNRVSGGGQGGFERGNYDNDNDNNGNGIDISALLDTLNGGSRGGGRNYDDDMDRSGRCDSGFDRDGVGRFRS